MEYVIVYEVRDGSKSIMTELRLTAEVPPSPTDPAVLDLVQRHSVSVFPQGFAAVQVRSVRPASGTALPDAQSSASE